jgi:hypothetical protein
MINYYYEIKEDVSVFGRDDLKYLSIFDVKPNTVGWRHLHEEAEKHSRRVWLENANGISLVKTHHPYGSWEVVRPEMLTWLKLICKDIESL